MPYFLSDKILNLNQVVEISGEEASHLILSFRVKKTEKIKIQGPDGRRFLTEVVEINKKNLLVRALEQLTLPEEPKVGVWLFQSAVSEKALDFIFQKGTELGLGRVVLFNSANTAVRLSKDGFKKKYDRWNKILIEAAKQSERARWPELYFLEDIGQVAKKAVELDKLFLTDKNGEKNFLLPAGAKTCGLIVGPEGGFTATEVAVLQGLSNIKTVSLGPIWLRADTAVVASMGRLGVSIF